MFLLLYFKPHSSRFPFCPDTPEVLSQPHRYRSDSQEGCWNLQLVARITAPQLPKSNNYNRVLIHTIRKARDICRSSKVQGSHPHIISSTRVSNKEYRIGPWRYRGGGPRMDGWTCSLSPLLLHPRLLELCTHPPLSKITDYSGSLGEHWDDAVTFARVEGQPYNNKR